MKTVKLFFGALALAAVSMIAAPSAQSHYHWTAREVPGFLHLFGRFCCFQGPHT